MGNKQKILIIKADKLFNNILKKHFLSQDYEVETVNTGSEGLNKAKQNKPDLIILDVELPTISGFVVTQKLKKDNELKDIPVIMISSLTQENNIKRGYDLGIRDFMTEPVHINTLTEKVAEYIHEAKLADVKICA